jgi:hypothetical protein
VSAHQPRLSEWFVWPSVSRQEASTSFLQAFVRHAPQVQVPTSIVLGQSRQASLFKRFQT